MVHYNSRLPGPIQLEQYACFSKAGSHQAPVGCSDRSLDDVTEIVTRASRYSTSRSLFKTEVIRDMSGGGGGGGSDPRSVVSCGFSCYG